VVARLSLAACYEVVPGIIRIDIPWKENGWFSAVASNSGALASR
jgi:hypothetical protein